MTRNRRLQRFGQIWAGLAVLVLLALPGASPAQEQEDPALAPPLEQLEEDARRWRERRRNGALLLLGSLAVASVIIGEVRRRQRRARKARPPAERVDKDAPGPPG